MSYKLTILSPTGVLAKTESAATYLPTATGEIGILPGHRAYCGVLAPGIIRYSTTAADPAPKTIEIKGGFAEFSHEELVVFAS